MTSYEQKQLLQRIYKCAAFCTWFEHNGNWCEAKAIAALPSDSKFVVHLKEFEAWIIRLQLAR